MKRNKEPKQFVKGAPSGFVISLIIHAAIIVLAGMLVVFNVTKKEEKKFVPPVPVDRPKMKLIKPKVKVKKSAKPKSHKRIITRVKQASMPSIQLPEMTGIGDSMVGASFGGFAGLPDMEEVNVFGGAQTIGNDFKGTIYHLLFDRRGAMIAMDKNNFMQVLRGYARSGFKKSKLARYFQAPKKLHTTFFMIPPIVSPLAMDAFGVPDLESYYFFINYKGKLVFKEDIKFRFWGQGDAFINVLVDGEHVLVNGDSGLDHWQQPSNDGSDKFRLGKQTLRVGDWIELKAGESKDMEVFFGELNGGLLACGLLVEVEGVEYPQTRQGGPLLPVFKTEELTRDQLEEIYKYLPEGECNLTNGPIFRDY